MFRVLIVSQRALAPCRDRHCRGSTATVRRLASCHQRLARFGIWPPVVPSTSDLGDVIALYRRGFRRSMAARALTRSRLGIASRPRAVGAAGGGSSAPASPHALLGMWRSSPGGAGASVAASILSACARWPCRRCRERSHDVAAPADLDRSCTSRDGRSRADARPIVLLNPAVAPALAIALVSCERVAGHRRSPTAPQPAHLAPRSTT